MFKKATIIGVTVIVIIMLLYFSNPGVKRHIRFLEKKFKIQISWKKGADYFSGDDGTIRKLYAASVGENAIHGSDSDENAKN